MIEFDNPADEQRFIQDFVNSKFWAWIDDYLTSRMNVVLQEKEDMTLPGEARWILDGRLIEIRRLLQIPNNAATFFAKQREIEKKLAAGVTNDPDVQELLRTQHPDVITH